MNDNTTLCSLLTLIILWVVLCSGTPDLIDAMVKRVGGYTIEEMKGESK